jgi:hypothetical protein
MAKTPRELLNERKQRVLDAVALKVPDRVPIFFPLGVFGAKYSGITVREAFENTEKWQDINEKLLKEYQPDYFLSPNTFDMPSNELLGSLLQKWPGHGVGVNASYQAVEGEYLKAEEYDAFMDNPGDFVFRKYLPRAFTNLAGFSQMPQLISILTFSGIFHSFSDADALQALENVVTIARSTVDRMKAQAAYVIRMEAQGFPFLIGMGGLCPFDIISDYLRGMKGTTIDMFRRPDKLLALEQKLLPFAIDFATGSGRHTSNILSFVALHRGSDAFMSLKQFETFYWPGLKTVLQSIIDAGKIPMVFWEGRLDERLEYIKELPKGKILGWFDRTNLFKAKEIIGDTMCICGDMPLSLLQTGTPEQVKEYAKKLIDVVGKGGGFIMGPNTELDYAKPELVKVWVDATREYGVYS